MKRIANIGSKKNIVEVICLLYILLFVYAATSKLADFENFRVQIGQSPMLSSFADWISFAVIFLEYSIATMLVFLRFRLVGLYLSFLLMVMFTTYIVIILTYASYVPCSCGGILEKMGWSEHLYFNIAFVLLAVIALLLYPSRAELTSPLRIRIGSLFLLMFFGAVITISMHLLSKDIMQTKGTFVRSFPPHPAEFTDQLELEYNSYYFAGYKDGIIYLGNYTTPLDVILVDSSLSVITKKRISPEESNFSFRSIQLRVAPPNFYLLDGTVPCVYGGSIKDWKAKLLLKDEPYFTLAEPLDSISFAFRSNKGETGENVLGVFKMTTPPQVKLSENLLQKQSKDDGIFDTDGLLLYSSGFSSIIYIYQYRNQFIVANKNGELNYNGNTIDTVSKAQIKVAKLSKGNQIKMSAPPLTVNAHAAAYNNLLFVNSTLRGKYDNEKIWKNSSTIDVYDLKDGSYIMSFYIPQMNNNKLRSFIVTATNIYVLIDTQLVSYKITNNLKNEMLKFKDNGN